MKTPTLLKQFASFAFTSSLLCVSGLVSAKDVEEGAKPALTTQIAKEFLLTDIVNVGDRMVAVGERGHIIYSNDGENWQQANVPVNVLLTSVVFNDQLVGFATGHDATILKSEDGGLNWSLVSYKPSLDKPFLDVSLNGQRVVAVGAYGLYWESNDGGASWAEAYQDELLYEDDRLFLNDMKEHDPESYEIEKQFLLPHFNHISMLGDVWYLAGEAGFFAKSENKGVDWQRIETDYFGSYFALDELSDSRLLLSGLRGNVFQSDDSGQSWESIATPTKATINNSLVTQDAAYLFANSGNMFYLIGDKMHHKAFADGKALLAGVIFNNSLIMATEGGIKSIALSKLESR